MGWKSFRYFCLCCSNTVRRVEATEHFLKATQTLCGNQESPTWASSWLITTYPEGPEWVRDDEFFEGKWPEKKSPEELVFALIEIYDTEEGLHHHYIESAEFVPEFSNYYNL